MKNLIKLLTLFSLVSLTACSSTDELSIPDMVYSLPNSNWQADNNDELTFQGELGSEEGITVILRMGDNVENFYSINGFNPDQSKFITFYASTDSLRPVDGSVVIIETQDSLTLQFTTRSDPPKSVRVFYESGVGPFYNNVFRRH